MVHDRYIWYRLATYGIDSHGIHSQLHACPLGALHLTSMSAMVNQHVASRLVPHVNRVTQRHVNTKGSEFSLDLFQSRFVFVQRAPYR